MGKDDNLCGYVSWKKNVWKDVFKEAGEMLH